MYLSSLYVWILDAQSCLTLCKPMVYIAHQAHLSMELLISVYKHKYIYIRIYTSIYFCVYIHHCLVAKSCPTLGDPMDCSMPGFPVLHYLSWSLLKLMSIDSVMPSNHLILCGSLLHESLVHCININANRHIS